MIMVINFTELLKVCLRILDLGISKSNKFLAALLILIIWVIFIQSIKKGDDPKVTTYYGLLCRKYIISWVWKILRQLWDNFIITYDKMYLKIAGWNKIKKISKYWMLILNTPRGKRLYIKSRHQIYTDWKKNKNTFF